MRLSPVHAFALRAALWLPASFVVWFAGAAVWSWPAVRLAKIVLTGLWPGLFSALHEGGDVLDASGHVVAHAGYLATLTTAVVVNVPATAGSTGGIGVLEPVLNPMVYAYSLPLFSGLVLATPLPVRKRLGELVIAFVVIGLAQAFGIVAESLKFLAVDAGSAGAAAIAQAGLSSDAIAFAYQFAFLILPAVVPAVLWIGLNRGFIAELVDRAGEPGPETAV
ncbi:MAG TPA: exosortase H-associated membrane protein [Rhodanobacteraceae bacterium]|nr:exosortase H-associated membrane protein [Rhodanobacteraceae bacterium]